MRRGIEKLSGRVVMIAAFSLVLLVTACALPPEAEQSAAPDAAVSGTVTYLQRSALAPGSVITVQVQDVSRMDVAAEIIGEQVIVTTGEQVPVAFSVPYSTAGIVPTNRYIVRATIDDAEGNLLLTSDTTIPVISNGAPTSGVEIVVVPVGGGGASAPDASVTGTVSYMQRSALVPGSIITVQVQDVSRVGAPAVVIGEQIIVTSGEQVPVAFAVPYNSADIVDNHTYSVRATIDNPEGRLIFTSDTFTPVITSGAPTSDIAVLVVPVGAGAPTTEPDAAVTGTVTYLQRSALAEGSVITVQVQDVSRMDVAAEIIGEQVITTTGEQVPLPFQVDYSSSAIVDSNRYVVRATIEDAAGNLLFTNDTIIPVITNGAPTSDVEVLVVPVGDGGATAEPDAAVTGTVTYLQRSALAEGSVITVQVQDVSRMDVAAEIIGEQVIVTTGEQVPIAFEVGYNSSAIVDNHTYAVRATIDDAEGNLLFTSDTFTPVISRGAPTEGVEIVVVPVGGATAPEPDAVVTGTVSYLQFIALPPGSIISVRVQDTSLADAPAITIGEQVIVTTDQQVPVPFEVGYSSADIVENHTYSIRATIEDAAGNLLFVTDTFTPVITNGAPTSDIELILVQIQ